MQKEITGCVLALQEILHPRLSMRQLPAHKSQLQMVEEVRRFEFRWTISLMQLVHAWYGVPTGSSRMKMVAKAILARFWVCIPRRVAGHAFAGTMDHEQKAITASAQRAHSI